ncbi:hypothetical protein SLEP1_g49927 [Rubroshorea leprosula]|uniref:Cyclic nucleotide-binding domain-containing protein n=1 Tax=Rubroshorea leprosula TaxID=152421 RepID=A0AAV5M0W0_9ROSI|nr:hypothetical protein SLEP1_g49927 [Rubroshorea leprosula]
MATHKREFSVATHKQYLLNDNYESQEEEIYQLDSEEDYEEEDEEDKSPRDCKSMHYMCGGGRRKGWSLGQVLDPRTKWVQEWNRVNLLFILTGLFLDPLSFYALSISDQCMCLYIDGWFAITITALRCITDAFHVWNVWLQLKMDTRLYSYTAPMAAAKDEVEGEGGGGGASHTATAGGRMAVRYLNDWKEFFFDLFVILPIPQIVVWVIIPSMLKEGSVTKEMTVFLFTFLFPIPPKDKPLRLPPPPHAEPFRLRFGDNWWGHFPQPHRILCRISSGACWYMLGIQRSAQCLRDQCRQIEGCDLRILAAKEPIYYGTTQAMRERARLAWAGNNQVRSTCIESPHNYGYGAYEGVVQLVTNESHLEKILFPIFWGIMNLSTFGNLVNTTAWSEALFSIIVLTLALILLTMLLANIKVFLHAITSKKQGMQLKMRKIEWWMRKKNLPQELRQRVRNYQQQKWASTRGVDESEMIRTLHEGLRRDIKYHLCFDLVRQVPLFQHMDDLVLENICDRVKSLIFTKGETITKEGDPVQRMLFVVRGHLQSSQVLRSGVKSYCTLGPGNFCGDELLSWCLRRPFIERLPPSSSTLVTLETTEAFGLEAGDVKYVTQHFRYTFVNEKVKRSARYYSPGEDLGSSGNSAGLEEV